jgi:hypothetical protein
VHLIIAHSHTALTLTLAHSNTTTCHNCALVNGPQAPPDFNVIQYQPHWVKILVWCHCTIEYWGGGPGLFYLLEYYYHLVTLTLTLTLTLCCVCHCGATVCATDLRACLPACVCACVCACLPALLPDLWPHSEYDTVMNMDPISDVGSDSE